LAKDLADALARQCGIASRSGLAEEERMDLENQIRRLSEMINESLEGLQEKREERNKALLNRRVELETRIHKNGAVVRQLREKSRGPKFPNLEANLATRLEGLVAESSVAEQQRARWINDFGPEHPEVKRLDGVIGKLELERMEAVDGRVSSLSTQISEDQAEVKRITTLTNPGTSDQQKENPTDGPALLMKIRKDILENLATETIRQKALLDLGLEPSKVKPTVTFFDSARVPVRKTRWRPE
jgi:chromosome segregation ATPase